MGIKEVVYTFFLKLELSSEGLFDDWFRALILLLLFTLSFGHSIDKHLEKRHFFSYFIGFLLAMFPVILIFFLFHFLELYVRIESSLFYNVIYVIFVLIALRRLFHHTKEKKRVSKKA